MFSGLETRCFISNKNQQASILLSIQNQNKLSPSLSSVYIGLDGVEMTILNTEIIALMRLINQDLDTDYGHRKMTAALKLIGYQINYKKVYRLMKETQMLKESTKNQ
jgi:hypothetical protein